MNTKKEIDANRRRIARNQKASEKNVPSNGIHESGYYQKIRPGWWYTTPRTPTRRR